MKPFIRWAFAIPALGATLAGGVFAFTNNVHAAGSSCGKDPKCVIAWGDARIADRIAKLTTLNDRVNANTHLTADQKSALTGDAQTNITNLQTLKTKLDAETDVTAARADVKSIFTQFRIYAVVLPRDDREAVLDHLTNLQAKFVANEPKIQQAIQAAANKGVNVSQEQEQYTDLVAKVNAAATQDSAAQALVASLTPANYPGTAATLAQMKGNLKAAHDDLVAAHTDLKQIISELKLQSTSPSVTPTP